MKKVLIAVCLLALLPFAPGAVIAGNGAETGHYSWPGFHYVQDYSGWGPACYYGQDVRVVHDATNTWTYVLQKGNVRETLVQNGIVKIYDMSNNLLDERTFTVMERFFDEGVDLAIRHDYGTSVWYEASHNPYSDKLESYEYIWKIPGVYDFRVWNRGGNWSYAWKSGECEDGWSVEDGQWFREDWPPKPPHPFNTGP